MKSSKEYYDEHYDPDSWHWKHHGIHAYNSLKHFEENEKEYKGERKEGLCSEKVKCVECNLLIYRHDPVVKIGKKAFHPSCEPFKR